jgi:hypothetical protein
MAGFQPALIYVALQHLLGCAASIYQDRMIYLASA